MARQLTRGAATAVAAALLLALPACTDESAPQDRAVKTCDLLPLDDVAAALALPGQDADDLQLTSGDYDATLDGTRPDGHESGPLVNECIVGGPSRATLRVTSFMQDTPAGTPEEVVGQSCDAFEPFPAAVDTIGGTCLALSTEARGRWGDQRIVVQLYRVAGQQASDRASVADIADQFAQARERLVSSN